MNLSGARGPPLGDQAPWWRALGAGRARGAPGPLVAPLASPLRLYILRLGKPSRTEPFSAISPLFREDSLLSTMDSTWMTREYFPLDHGSVISSYVMFSSPLCSSWIRPRELPYMIEALL